ncbi:hypothetical protein HGRIS_013685 [Hohenbuehelia grisea]|uniref:Hydrophobin n=1 Tax=Hohenbuehelia grisea TaxID=104357 RepID=A0ABR3IW85_9AGAR
MLTKYKLWYRIKSACFLSFILIPASPLDPAAIPALTLKMHISKNTILFSIATFATSLVAAAPQYGEYYGYSNNYTVTSSASSSSGSALPTLTPRAANSCNVGTLSCCNSFQEADSQSSTDLSNFLGTSFSGSTGQIGFACSSAISDTGLGGGNSCTQQAGCCSGTEFNGLIATGCTSIITPAAA